MSSAVPSPAAATRRPPQIASRVRIAQKKARATRARRVRLTARASVLAVVVLVLLTLGVAPLRTLLDQRGQLAQLEHQTHELEAANAELERRIVQLNDPVYLERLARECLGMIEPGETAFVLIPKRGALPAPQC